MTNNYTRDEVIDLTLKQVDAWRKTPKEELYDSPDHSSAGHPYPQTKVEDELVELLHVYLTSEWLQPDTEPLLYEIESDLMMLDTGVNRPKTWDYVFKLCNELREIERPQSK